MKISRKKRLKPILPVNSMSDIAFLLLIFIMLISLINYRREIKVEYPEAEYQEITQAEKNLEIWVDSVGTLFIDGKAVDIRTAEGVISDAVAKDPSIRIHIIADKNTSYKNINQIMEVLKLLQHRVVSLVVREKKQ